MAQRPRSSVSRPAASTARNGRPWPRRKGSACSPSIIAIVVRVPAARHAGATTLIDCQPCTGHPVRGSRMWQ
jgi:hypothetical protein